MGVRPRIPTRASLKSAPKAIALKCTSNANVGVERLKWPKAAAHRCRTIEYLTFQGAKAMLLDGGLLANCAANWPQKENLATDALRYILHQSPAANSAINKLLNEAFKLAGTSLTGPLGFEAQMITRDNSRPDLTVFDRGGQRCGILEIKLFARLTERQPLVYLANLPSGRKGLLLFVAPACYLPSLWEDLCDACGNGCTGRLERIHPTPDGYFRIARFDGGHLLAAISWKSLFEYLDRHMDKDSNDGVPSDLLQLRTFVERIDPTMNFQAWSPLKGGGAIALSWDAAGAIPDSD